MRSKRGRVNIGPIDGLNVVGKYSTPQRTNKPGTCLFCGKKLRAYRYPDLFPNPNRRGDYGDNAFCGLRCGYRFGLAFAALGRRLAP